MKTNRNNFVKSARLFGWIMSLLLVLILALLVYSPTIGASASGQGKAELSADPVGPYPAVANDPSASFITGGGWIDSLPGAYMADTSLAGKATFGFVSKYKKSASVPTGNIEFQSQAGGFDFRSDTYDWLVVNQNGATAQFKGSGTVNGALDPNDNPYKFMLWADDGSPDTFRIRIWWEDASGAENVLYDNGFDQPIGGGSIVVHKGK
jgi:hypothetical protein